MNRSATPTNTMNLSGIIFPVNGITARENWKRALRIKMFRLKGLLTIIALAGVALSIPHFFGFIQVRQGIGLNDILLNHIAPQNVSWFIFPLLYGMIGLTLINIAAFPELFLRSLQAYTILMLIRMTLLYFLPLEPDRNLIPLEDPFIGKLFYSGNLITKDLFFSGHVSTIFILVLLNPVKTLTPVLLIATALIASFILIQHVHYTIDVVAAPFFAWLSYRISGLEIFQTEKNMSAFQGEVKS